MEHYTSKSRTQKAIMYQRPDRIPADFLAVDPIWDSLRKHFEIGSVNLSDKDFYDPAREEVLKKLDIDCRVVSYDQFFKPPNNIFSEDEHESWWDTPNRSTPNRMWRKFNSDGNITDIWGHRFAINTYGDIQREELCSFPLKNADSINDLINYSWPDTDWWDFSHLLGVIKNISENAEYHVRYRLGSIFESAWQLCGMAKFLEDMVLNPEYVLYLLEILTDIQIDVARQALYSAEGGIDMIYFYDDVATQESLLISKKMWSEFIYPFHKRICDLANEFNVSVMYHCDGSVYPLIPDLVKMGVNVLNPVQSTAKNMSHERIQEEFGGHICFHGGVDIDQTLQFGSKEDVINSVKQCKRTFAKNGGYILSSTHHIQENTPISNILTMYDLPLRY